MSIDRIIEDLIIIDGHSDIPRDIFLKETHGENDAFMKNHYFQLKAAGVNIVFANIFTKGTPESSLIEGLIEVEKIIKVTEKNEDVVIIKSKEDLEHVIKTKKLGLVLSMEGFEPLYNNLELLDMYYRFGIRSSMLTWNKRNLFASGTDEKTGGLTDLGKSAVKKMNELGILVDVSHLNEEGFWDVIKINRKPTIASHSNARALFNHDRNLSDEQIKAIANSGGVIGAVSYFSKVDEDNPQKVRTSDDDTETIHDVVKHIDYMVNLVGYDHVAFGFDFNMYLGDFGVKGLESVEKIKDLIKLLIERGHSLEGVRKIAGENWIRVLKEVL